MEAKNTKQITDLPSPVNLKSLKIFCIRDKKNQERFEINGDTTKIKQICDSSLGRASKAHCRDNKK